MGKFLAQKQVWGGFWGVFGTWEAFLGSREALCGQEGAPGGAPDGHTEPSPGPQKTTSRYPKTRQKHAQTCFWDELRCNFVKKVTFENLKNTPGGVLGGVGRALDCFITQAQTFEKTPSNFNFISRRSPKTPSREPQNSSGSCWDHYHT